MVKTTRANLNAQAAAAGLRQGENYLITDESRVAVGLSTTTYQDMEKRVAEESGSNADGEWVRWENGWQIVRKRLIAVYLTANAMGPAATWVFPKAFIAAPTPTGLVNWAVTTGVLNSSSYQTYSSGVSVTTLSATAADFRIGRAAGAAFASGDSVAIEASAFGRWK